jgi:predicted Zn-dependent protease
MTHPPTSERLVNLDHEIGNIQQIQPTALNTPIKRNQYIRTLDGLAVGEWNGQELIRGDYYYNKEFLLKMKLPEGWEGQINNKTYTAVFGQPKKDLYVMFNVEPLRTQKTSEDYFRDFEKKLGQRGLKKDGTTSSNTKYGGGIGAYKGSSDSLGAIKGVGFAFVNDINGYSLLGISKTADFQTFRPLVESMVQSLTFISQKEAADLQPARLKVHEVKGGETWESIMKKYFSTSEGKEKLAEYNGLLVNQNPAAGILLKIPPTLHFQ